MSAFAIKPANERGYHVSYRGDGTDRCPGCGRQHFHVGRASAECAFCATAVPLPEASMSGGRIMRTSRRAA